jgi:hypothetical protein
MEARVTAYSQVNRLRERVEQAEIRHGQEIRADLPGVRVTAMSRNWFTGRPTGQAEVFFCTMGPVRVREVTAPGDGAPLPRNVTVQGLEVPGEGTYDFLNILIQSNGDLRLVMDEASQALPAMRQAETSGYEPAFG